MHKLINEVIDESNKLDEIEWKKVVPAATLALSTLASPIANQANAAVPSQIVVPVQYKEMIDMDIIQQIENTSKNPYAISHAGARGMYQITPIVLKEWNNYFPNEKYTLDDLFHPDINKKIAYWYMYKRIPQLLKYSAKVPITVNNMIIAWNAGWTWTKKKHIPKETIKFINDYKRIYREIYKKEI